MSRVCSIHQPSYWPYLGLFEKIASSDVFVFLDDVQYTKNEFKNRNRLFISSAKGPDAGRVDWLTLPVRQLALSQTIQETTVPNSRSILRKHLATLRQAYSAAPFFKRYFPEIENLFESLAGRDPGLSEINVEATRLMIRAIGIQTEIFGLSSAITGKSDDPTQRLIDICKHTGADTYLAGAAGADYMRLELFPEQQLELTFQHWKPYGYPQIHSPGAFIPYLSCLDALFNEGGESIAAHLGIK